MTAFRKLKEIRTVEKKFLPHFRSHEDFDIVIEIGYHEEAGEPMTLKALLLLNIASATTVQRRVQNLIDEGAIIRKKCTEDQRRIRLHVSKQTHTLMENYVKQLTDISNSKPARKK